MREEYELAVTRSLAAEKAVRELSNTISELEAQLRSARREMQSLMTEFNNAWQAEGNAYEKSTGRIY